MYARSYYKRTLDTTSRYKYIKNAYENMKRWMTEGTEDECKLKRYIHCHLALPSWAQNSDGKELLTQFGFQYVQALITYCSDDLKTGMCLALCVTVIIIAYLSLTHTRVSHPVRAKYA